MFFESLDPERTQAHTLAKMVKLTICYLPLFRTGAVVALQCFGLIAVSHDLTHHKQVQLMVAYLSKGGLVVVHWEEQGAL